MARKPESDLPVLPSALPPLPPGHVQCAANAACRCPGRMKVDGMGEKERVCVNHYYLILDRERNAA